jgi:asparagine N-glycosylation enzyme membrane subunit Stt3
VSETTVPNRRAVQAALWVPLLLLLTVQGLLLWNDPAPLTRGALRGPDAYMRLVRVEALWQDGNWYDTVSRRSNTPYGERLHWTRPLDALLIAGAAPLVPIVGQRQALYWWGVVISPLLHILTLLAFLWALRPLFGGGGGTAYAAILFVAQPAILAYYAAGRPDHHGLIGLLFVLLMGLTLRLLDREVWLRHGVLAGLAAAALLWVAIEGLLLVGLVLLAAGICWLARGQALTRPNLALAAALALGSALALALEFPPAGLLAQEADRLSFMQFLPLACVAIFWRGVTVIEARTNWAAAPPGRTGVALVGLLFVLAVILLFVPKLLQGPHADVAPRVVEVWFHNILEVRPLLVAAQPLKSVREVLFFLGPALLAVPFVVFLVRNCSGARRRQWLFVAGGLLLFVPLALYQARWATFAELFVVPAYAALVLAVLARLDRLGGGEANLVRAVTRALVVVLFAVWALLAAAFLHGLEGASKGEVAAAESAKCPIGRMSRFLATAELAQPPRRILSFVFFGPEILYRTPHHVVATPYHRNSPGILDAFDALAAVDDAKARDIVSSRGIDWLLICRKGKEQRWYQGKNGGDGETLFDRLKAHREPPWLEPLTLPDDLSAFGLFAVKPR